MKTAVTKWIPPIWHLITMSRHPLFPWGHCIWKNVKLLSTPCNGSVYEYRLFYPVWCNTIIQSTPDDHEHSMNYQQPDHSLYLNALYTKDRDKLEKFFRFTEANIFASEIKIFSTTWEFSYSWKTALSYELQVKTITSLQKRQKAQNTMRWPQCKFPNLQVTQNKLIPSLFTTVPTWLNSNICFDTTSMQQPFNNAFKNVNVSYCTMTYLHLWRAVRKICFSWLEGYIASPLHEFVQKTFNAARLETCTQKQLRSWLGLNTQYLTIRGDLFMLAQDGDVW